MLSEIINVIMLHSINMQRQQINKIIAKYSIQKIHHCGTNILYCHQFVQCIRQYITGRTVVMK